MAMTRISLLLALWLTALGSARAAESTVSIMPVGGSSPIPARLIAPEGAGPFPAIVVMHDCSGLGARSSGAPQRWADELVPQGYAVLIPDSFSTRNLPNGVCTEANEKARLANGYVRAGDAYGALAYLRSLPSIDPKRIGIMGGSHGGWSTLASMYVPVDPNNVLAEAKKNGFAAAIALYPNCSAPFGAWSTKRENGRTGAIVSDNGAYRPIAPLLILVGEKDDWTPAPICERLAQVSQAAGYPVSIKVYPGAHHSFDSAAPVRFVAQRNNANAADGKGATTGGQPEAWADARIRVRDFFAQYLKTKS